MEMEAAAELNRLVTLRNDPWYESYAKISAGRTLPKLDLGLPAVRIVSPTEDVDPGKFAVEAVEETPHFYRIPCGEVLPVGVVRTPTDLVLKETLGWMRPAAYLGLARRAAEAGPHVHGDEIQYVRGEAAHILAPGFSFNHYHFMAESLSNLWFLDECDPDRRIPVLINKSWFSFPQQNAEHVLDRVVNCIQSVSGRGIVYTKSRVARVENLFVINKISPVMNAAYNKFYERLRATILGGSTTQDGHFERIYVSRSGARIRRILNEDAVIRSLEPRGFSVVRLERLGFEDQIRLFAGARLIVAPHGAGLVNCLFSKPGTSVVELLSTSNYMRGDLYRKLNEIRSLRHHLFIGEAVNQTARGDSDIVVDLPALLRLIDGL
jgi:hypothetical protein